MFLKFHGRKLLRKLLRISISDILEFEGRDGTRECRDLRFTYYNEKENVKSGFSTDGRDLRPRAVNTRIAKGTADLTILRPRADRRWKSCALSAWSFLLWDIRASSKFSKHFHRRRFVHRVSFHRARLLTEHPKRNRSFLRIRRLRSHCINGPCKRWIDIFLENFPTDDLLILLVLKWIIFNNKTVFCLWASHGLSWNVWKFVTNIALRN